MNAKVILSSAVAVVLGTASAAVGAKYVETALPTPVFSLKGERFNVSTFTGRWAKMLSNGDPSTLFHSRSEVMKAVHLLDSYKLNATEVRKSNSDAQLWAARKIVESSLHPDTLEIVPQPFRMAGYVPFNGPVCSAMMASTSTTALLFWNWVNQSQNALVNYFNRNASSTSTMDTLVMSYAGAVVAAMSVAFGVSQAIKRSFSPSAAEKLLKFVAFPSSVVASSSNCYIMRRPEIDSGIGLLNEKGEPLKDASGKQLTSSKAAEKAVMETVTSRALLQVPVFFGSALFMSLPPVVNFVKRSPTMNIPLMTLVTMIFFAYGLPATIAVFPQVGSIDRQDLEQENKKYVTNSVAFYNKGL